MKFLTETGATRKVCCAYPRCENPFEQIDVPENLFEGDKISADNRNMYHGSFYVTAWGEVCCCYDCYRELSLF